MKSLNITFLAKHDHMLTAFFHREFFQGAICGPLENLSPTAENAAVTGAHQLCWRYIHAAAKMGTDKAEGIDILALPDNRKSRFSENKGAAIRNLGPCYAKQGLFFRDSGSQEFP
jgi:hypothetical protein